VERTGLDTGEPLDPLSLSGRSWIPTGHPGTVSWGGDEGKLLLLCLFHARSCERKPQVASGGLRWPQVASGGLRNTVVESVIETYRLRQAAVTGCWQEKVGCNWQALVAAVCVHLIERSTTVGPQLD
jgi:hypothetical protein